MAHHGEAYPGFYSMKRLGVFLHPMDGMLVHRSVAPATEVAHQTTVYSSLGNMKHLGIFLLPSRCYVRKTTWLFLAKVVVKIFIFDGGQCLVVTFYFGFLSVISSSKTKPYMQETRLLVMAKY